MRWDTDKVMAHMYQSALIATGIGILWWQNGLQHPSDLMVTAALAAIGLPGAHAGAVVWRERGTGPSSEPSPPLSRGASGSRQGGTGDG